MIFVIKKYFRDDITNIVRKTTVSEGYVVTLLEHDNRSGFIKSSQSISSIKSKIMNLVAVLPPPATPPTITIFLPLG